MPLVTILWGAFYAIIGSLVAKVLFAMGIGFVAFNGIDFLIETARTNIFIALGDTDSIILQFAGVFQVGTCINIILSAFTVRLTIAGLIGGKLTRMVIAS